MPPEGTGIRARFEDTPRSVLAVREAGNAMFIAIPGRTWYTASAQEFFGVPGHNIRPEA